MNSLHAQSAGEDSNSSDTAPSDRGDHLGSGHLEMGGTSIAGLMDGNSSLDSSKRSHAFSNAFLGLQSLPAGLLPGPSGISANDFGKFFYCIIILLTQT